MSRASHRRAVVRTIGDSSLDPCRVATRGGVATSLSMHAVLLGLCASRTVSGDDARHERARAERSEARWRVVRQRTSCTR